MLMQCCRGVVWRRGRTDGKKTAEKQADGSKLAGDKMDGRRRDGISERIIVLVYLSPWMWDRRRRNACMRNLIREKKTPH